MIIRSINTGSLREITVNGKKEMTGYYKSPVEGSLYLGKSGVTGDTVVDKIHHGGADKACYLYSTDHYDFWRKKYPVPDWDYGIFGENLSIEGMDESQLMIGDVLQAGEVVMQVSQPRQPCYKMGIRFGTQEIVNEFRWEKFPGIYVRILQEGFVRRNDPIVLSERKEDSFTVTEVYEMIYSRENNREQLLRLIENPWLADSVKTYLREKFGI